MIKENNLYKRLLEYYIEKYGPPDDDVMKMTLEKLQEIESKDENKKNEKLISRDFMDYIHLHIISTSDYIEEMEKNLQIMKRMNSNLDHLIKRMKE